MTSAVSSNRSVTAATNAVSSRSVEMLMIARSDDRLVAGASIHGSCGTTSAFERFGVSCELVEPARQVRAEPSDLRGGEQIV